MMKSGANHTFISDDREDAEPPRTIKSGANHTYTPTDINEEQCKPHLRSKRQR